MRKTVLIVSVLIAVLIDHFLFPGLGIVRRAPGFLIALFVSLSVLTGLLPSMPIAVSVGIVLDICFNRFIGMCAIPLFCASLAGAVFYSRFYADNIILPAITAAFSALFKELFLFIVVLLGGGRVSGLFSLFALHMLPSAILTGAICALIHPLLKRILPRAYNRAAVGHLR